MPPGPNEGAEVSATADAQTKVARAHRIARRHIPPPLRPGLSDFDFTMLVFAPRLQLINVYGHRWIFMAPAPPRD